eukprot:325312-Pyramimonas_sp.AAC.1
MMKKNMLGAVDADADDDAGDVDKDEEEVDEEGFGSRCGRMRCILAPSSPWACHTHLTSISAGGCTRHAMCLSGPLGLRMRAEPQYHAAT